jgi:hypothetical protein
MSLLALGGMAEAAPEFRRRHPAKRFFDYVLKKTE